MNTSPAIVQGRNLSRHYHLSGGMFGEDAVVRALQDVSFDLSTRQDPRRRRRVRAAENRRWPGSSR